MRKPLSIHKFNAHLVYREFVRHTHIRNIFGGLGPKKYPIPIRRYLILFSVPHPLKSTDSTALQPTSIKMSHRHRSLGLNKFI